MSSDRLSPQENPEERDKERGAVLVSPTDIAPPRRTPDPMGQTGIYTEEDRNRQVEALEQQTPTTGTTSGSILTATYVGASRSSKPHQLGTGVSFDEDQHRSISLQSTPIKEVEDGLDHDDTAPAGDKKKTRGGEDIGTEDTHLDVIQKLSLQEVYHRTGRRLLRSILYAAAARLLLGLVKALMAGPKKMLSTLQRETFSLNAIKWGLLVGGLSSYRAIQETISRGLAIPSAMLLPESYVSAENLTTTASLSNSLSAHHDEASPLSRQASSAGAADWRSRTALSSEAQKLIAEGSPISLGAEERQRLAEEDALAQRQAEIVGKRRQLLGEKIASILSSIIAGFAVSLSYRSMNLKTQTELSLYLATRAAHGLTSAHIFPRLPEEIRSPGGLTILSMTLSNWLILYGLLFEPSCHPKGYVTFLRKCTLLDTRVLETIAALHRQVPCPESYDYVRNILKDSHRALLPTKAPFPIECSCQFVHPGTTCELNIVNFVLRHFATFAMPLYVPLKTTTTLVFGAKKAVKEPLKTTWKILKASIRSSAFLTALCTPATLSMCIAARLGFTDPTLVAGIAALGAGAATLSEPQSRRVDLALYCAMQAFRFTTNLLAKRGVINPTGKNHIYLLSGLGLAAIFYQFDHEWTQLHPNVRKALQWLTAEKRSSKTRTYSADKQKQQLMDLINPPPVELLDDVECYSECDSMASTARGTPRTSFVRRTTSNDRYNFASSPPGAAAARK